MSQRLPFAVMKNFEVVRCQATDMPAARVGYNGVHLDEIDIELKRFREHKWIGFGAMRGGG